jgi:hypothetical protein
MLRKYDAPYMADWFAISLRWITLVGLIVSLGLAGKLGLFISWPLGLLIVWNLAMTAMAGMNARIAYHRFISTLVDLVLAGAFYWVQGGLRGPAVWAGLLPILTGSIYFELGACSPHYYSLVHHLYLDASGRGSTTCAHHFSDSGYIKFDIWLSWPQHDRAYEKESRTVAGFGRKEKCHSD